MADSDERLFIALYTDADVHGKLAAQIRKRGFDVISAYETANAALDDAEQLEYATSQQRAILTCNTRHFAPLYQLWWQAKRKHYGIICLPTNTPGSNDTACFAFAKSSQRRGIGKWLS